MVHRLTTSMLLRLAVFFLSCRPFTTPSRADNVQGDNFCSTLMCVTAFTNSSTMTYQLTALNQLGWMAVGFGTQMTDAEMVIVWPNSDGNVVLSQRTATGLVEPVPEPSPPRIATLYSPLTNISYPSAPSIAFTVPKDDTVLQNAIWAFAVANPMSSSPSATLQLHLDSGNFTLNLSNQIEIGDIPALNPSPSFQLPSSSSKTDSPTTSAMPTVEMPSTGPPFAMFEKLIIVHAILSTTGFLLLLPVGALIARWGRTFSDNWFYYHWTTQVILSIPVVVTGWALGPLSVAIQGSPHVNDSHKVLGILLLPLYLVQLSLGTFMHFLKPAYPRRHPPRHIAHGLLGTLIIGLAFYQTRTGIAAEWTMATARAINLSVFSNLWIAWVIFVPAIYFSGFLLLPRQLGHERELPPPYSPGDVVHEGGEGTGMRELLGLDPGAMDDGTHDLFSEDVSRTRQTARRRTSTSYTPGGIEMREVQSTRWTPLSFTSSPAPSTTVTG